jgi:hypothetical protein
MMMDVHEPLSTEEIDEINPQAAVDKTLGAVEDEVGDDTSVDRAYPYEVPLPENVEYIPTETSNNLPAEHVLRNAFDSKLVDLVICGIDEDGNEYVLRTNTDPAESVWHLQRAIHILNLRCDRRMMEKHGTPLDDHPNPSA